MRNAASAQRILSQIRKNSADIFFVRSFFANFCGNVIGKKAVLRVFSESPPF